MNRLLLKAKFKTLIKTCGGLDDAVEATRAAEKAGEGRAYSRSQLQRCYEPTAPDYAPVDVVTVLEAFCGEPIVSRAMVEARPAGWDGGCIREEASEATEAVAALQAIVRRATAGGDEIDAVEGREILAALERGERELRDVAEAFARRLKHRGGQA